MLLRPMLQLLLYVLGLVVLAVFAVPERGFFDREFMRITRGTSRPFHAGDEVVLSDMRARAVTEDGRPAEVDFTFALPLEDRSLLWRRLHAGGLLTPWSPAAVGERVLLPAVAPQSAAPAADASQSVATSPSQHVRPGVVSPVIDHPPGRR